MNGYQPTIKNNSNPPTSSSSVQDNSSNELKKYKELGYTPNQLKYALEFVPSYFDMEIRKQNIV